MVKHTIIHNHITVKNRSCFTEFFDKPNDFNRSPDGEVMDELSKIEIDFFKGTTKRKN